MITVGEKEGGLWTNKSRHGILLFPVAGTLFFMPLNASLLSLLTSWIHSLVQLVTVFLKERKISILWIFIHGTAETLHVQTAVSIIVICIVGAKQEKGNFSITSRSFVHLLQACPLVCFFCVVLPFFGPSAGASSTQRPADSWTMIWFLTSSLLSDGHYVCWNKHPEVLLLGMYVSVVVLGRARLMMSARPVSTIDIISVSVYLYIFPHLYVHS